MRNEILTLNGKPCRRLTSTFGTLRAGRLAGFHENYRESVQELSSMSPRIEDLSESFPALLFALATGYATPEKRATVFDMVLEGAPLKETASVFGLPHWLRKLPSEAFSKPLRDLPDSDGCARRIGSFVPKSPGNSAVWFNRICDAYDLAGTDYMLWMAKQRRFPFGSSSQDALALLGAWAWASTHPESFAHRLLRHPWMPDMSLKRAYDEARAWERRADLAITLGAGLQDTWFASDTVHGYTFVPITTIEAFLEEAQAMGNCLDQYAEPINNSHVRVFSIRKDGTPIANLELIPHDDDCLMPGIEQLRGPRNNRAAPDVWQAAYAWMGQQSFRVFPGPSHGGRAGILEAWQALWQPIITDVTDTQLRRRLRNFARQAHGTPSAQREANRLTLDI